MPGLKERAKTLVELLDGAQFLFAARPLAMDEKAAACWPMAAAQIIGALLPALEVASRVERGLDGSGGPRACRQRTA